MQQLLLILVFLSLGIVPASATAADASLAVRSDDVYVWVMCRPAWC